MTKVDTILCEKCKKVYACENHVAVHRGGSKGSCYPFKVEVNEEKGLGMSLLDKKTLKLKVHFQLSVTHEVLWVKMTCRIA